MKTKKYKEAGKAVPKPKFATVLDGAPGKFKIKLQFTGKMTDSQKAVVTKAKDRWEEIITGGGPRAKVGDEVIDGLLIVVEAKKIDGKGHTDGRTRPDSLIKRASPIEHVAFLPAKGVITFDIDDLKDLEKSNQLIYTALHEIGHMLGIGMIWEDKGLLKYSGNDKKNPTFVGAGAMKAYGDLLGSGPTPVPVENSGTTFQQLSHWRDSVFGDELMTSVGDLFPVLSLMTIMSLQDLGYKVNPQAADFYGLPTA